MKIGIVPHVVTGEIDNSFVGMKIAGNQIHFYYPESYHFNPNNYKKDDFLDLLKTISIAKSFSKDLARTNNLRKYESELAFSSYIWVIEDYLKNGIYKKSEKILKLNQHGKINWKKTFQQQPIVTNGNVVYQNLYFETNCAKDSIIIEAHRFCVKKSIKLIGWIYGLVPESIETNANAEKKVSFYLNAIESELDSTFNDEKREKLLHLENVLIGLDESDNKNDIVYGVDSYNYIFERMIDGIFGTEKINIDEYYPSFTWHLKYSANGEGLAGPTIRPDTIMKDGNNIYIIDSKFYRYGALDLSKTKGLPEASSIVKQIMYGSYIKSEHPSCNVYNVFILPYNAYSFDANGSNINTEDKKLIYIGKVQPDQTKCETYESVHTYLIDLKYVIKTWNRMIHDKDRKKVISEVNGK